MNSKLPFFLFFLLSSIIHRSQSSTESSILFSTLGRSRFSFDVFSVPISISPSSLSVARDAEQQLTDGISVNYNGFFPSDPSGLLSLLLPSSPPSLADSPPLVYVTERDGFAAIYLDHLHNTNFSNSTRRAALERPVRVQIPLLPSLNDAGSAPVSMQDRPTISGEYLIYVSTHEPSAAPRQSWAAVYSTHLPTGRTRRLTPSGIADFSPSVSPSGLWTAVASFGDGDWDGQDRNTNIYVFRTQDGSQRTLLLRKAGWPCWADDNTLYFHRYHTAYARWRIFRADVTMNGSTLVLADFVTVLTHPGIHAFTPAVSPGAPGLIAMATRKFGDESRHIQILDVRNGSYNFLEVTLPIHPDALHFNPFISPDGTRIGYHRCRGPGGNGSPPLLLENTVSASPESLSLFRFDGSFPSVSPDGSRIAYTVDSYLNVVNSDGSSEPRNVLHGGCLATAWDWKRRGVIYTSLCPPRLRRDYQDVISVSLDDDEENSEPSIRKLTTGGENNAFPSPSPDGKWVVFQSGRSGHKNLYVMDAVDGETEDLRQLTEGPWTDTMCNWSPDGEWIAFASDRHNPGRKSFAIYMMHPNGTGLQRVVHSGDEGRTNQPWFSPDSKRLAFTSDYAGLSAEPISNPNHYEPYGDIFTVNIDGSDIQRLTHNSYEDRTPTWAPVFLKPKDVSESLQDNAWCEFDDDHWFE